MMKCVFLLFAFLYGLPVASSQTLESVNEVLPIHHPTDGRKTVLLSYTNRHDKTIVIDSYSAACVCSRDVKIPKSVIEPGESISLELNFLVPNRPQESLQLDFSVSGHLADTDEKEHARELAKYHLEVPVYEPLGMLRKHAFLSVVGGAKCSTEILNATVLKWVEVRVRVVEFPDLLTETKISTTLIGKTNYQTVVVEIDGFQKLLTAPEKPESISLLLFARVENQASLVSIGEVKVPIKWLSEIEHFPKKITVESATESIEVNLVGRGVTLSEIADEVTVTVDSSKLDVSKFAVSKLSPKWLRISVDSAVVRKQSDSTNVLLIKVPSRGWQFSVDVEFPQTRIGEKNEE